MKCNFHVGQKVVCVELEKLYPDGVEPLEEPCQPIVGKVYTIREVLIGLVGQVPCVKLVEIPDQRINVLVHGELLHGDVVFDAVGFRPLVTRKTDISIFKAMLNPSRVEELA